MEDELLNITIKQSPMWEINNPRVNGLIRAFFELINQSDSFNEAQKEEFYYILIALVKVYGNKGWCL
jgi:hypothetical protein